MARTASMTVATAEAAIGSANALIVTSANRALLRKWATAKGYPAIEAYKFSAVELANLYHKYGPNGSAGEPLPIRGDIPMPAPALPATAPRLPAGDAAQQLLEAIRAITVDGAKHAPLDESRVREIAKEEVAANLAPAPQVVISRLEVSGPNGLNVIEGLTHEITAKVIKIAALGHHVMLVGPAGCGKTTIGQHVAIALGLECFITSTVFDTHELLGFVDGYGKYHSTAFRKAFEHGGVWVADEIDAWDAAALLAMNSALANGVVTFPDSEHPVRRHADFRVIAAANTFGHGADRVYVGRNELDAASLDRFATIAMDYDGKLEGALCGGNLDWLNRVLSVRTQCRAKNIRHVVSTRAIISGVQALAIGLDTADVENIYLFKGMSQSDRAKIT